MENTEKKGIFYRIYNWFKNLTVKGLLGVILIALIIVIIFASVSYLPSIISRVSSSLSAALYSIFVPAEKATMVADKKIVNSGEDFNINFKKGDIENGLFSISYVCNPGVKLYSVESNGLKEIDCNTRYYLLDNETAINIRPETDDSVSRLVIEGVFENNDTQKIEKVGVVRITVRNDSIGVVPNPPQATSTPNDNPIITNPGNTYVPPTIKPAYYGKPDLAVRILQVGLLNNGTNFITTQNRFTYQDMVGIKFEVRNDGANITGPWYFTASLPSISTPTFNSNVQMSLRPGESIIYTLGFSNLTNLSSSLITINVDPQNMVKEDIEYNNIVTSSIINTSSGSNYYRDNYNNGCYVNGYFTYNCYDTDWDYTDSDLEVSCYADPDDPETGDRVRWYVEVDGGDGDYDYDWSGTNSLDSTSKNPTKTYTSRGTKRATVIVTDGDDNESSATCSVYVD